MPGWLSAGLWGLLAGSALLVGAGIGAFSTVPRRLVAAVMAFGGGVLIGLLSFELMDEAYRRGGALPAAVGFIGGALLYSLGNVVVSNAGGRHRKRSGHEQARERHEKRGSGLAIAVGSLLDSVPEAAVIGVGLIGGGVVSMVAVAGIFLSNVPEGLSSSAGMKRAGRSLAYIFGVWGAITVATGIAALVGFVVFAGLPVEAVAVMTAVAAGAILTMLATTMIPEAFSAVHEISGILAVFGFLCFFLLSKMVG